MAYRLHKVGDRFGKLTIVGRTVPKLINGKERREWVLWCDCGKVIQSRGAYFAYNQKASCGCSPQRKGGKPHDLTGQRFGSLTAMYIEPFERFHSSRIWHCICDCGKQCKMPAPYLRNKDRTRRVNCGSLSHSRPHRVNPPPTPHPYPAAASLLVAKYLHLAQKPQFFAKNNFVWEEDTVIDALMRVCWIISYKKEQGVEFSELKERSYIKAWLKYTRIEARSFDRFFANKKATEGKDCNRIDNQPNIGDVMTDATLPAKLDFKSQPSKNMPKRLKFRKC